MRSFCSAGRCPGRRFPYVLRYMLWLFVFISVCSLYLTPGDPIARDDLVELLRQLSEPPLLVGDFTTLHSSWGDTVASLTSNFSLSCLNSGLPTNYHRSTDLFSYVDLSFCSSSLVLILPGLVSPLSLEEIILRFCCLRFVPLLYLWLLSLEF